MRRDLAYWRRLILVFLVVLLAVLLMLPAALGVATIYATTHIPCAAVAQPSAYGMAFEEVTFASGEHTLPAYFIPGETDAVVIIAPPLNHNHGGQMYYGEIFHAAGLGVLSLGARQCIGQPSTLGYLEGDDVNAAYAYLTTRDDVDPQRVSVHGFSAAGAAALFGAARTPELRAVSAMGNYYDFEATIGAHRTDTSWVERGYAAGISWGYTLSTGLPVSVLKPVDVIGAINPRPVLLVYGTQEPAADGPALYAQTENGTLWKVEGAAHGEYLIAAPEETRAIVGGFHRRALLGDAGG